MPGGRGRGGEGGREGKRERERGFDEQEHMAKR
jgi:hypothetical protein